MRRRRCARLPITSIRSSVTLTAEVADADPAGDGGPRCAHALSNALPLMLLLRIVATPGDLDTRRKRRTGEVARGGRDDCAARCSGRPCCRRGAASRRRRYRRKWPRHRPPTLVEPTLLPLIVVRVIVALAPGQSVIRIPPPTAACISSNGNVFGTAVDASAAVAADDAVLDRQRAVVVIPPPSANLPFGALTAERLPVTKLRRSVTAPRCVPDAPAASVGCKPAARGGGARDVAGDRVCRSRSAFPSSRCRRRSQTSTGICRPAAVDPP